jgi:hypothetical protein
MKQQIQHIKIFLSWLVLCFVMFNFGNAVKAEAQYLHIATTDTTGSVQQALTDHGITFTLFNGSDWSGIDLSGYNTVVIGMDGGSVNTASVQNIANFVNNGGRVIIIGGTCSEEWALAVNTYLLANDVTNYCWSVSSSPQITVTNPAHPLAAGLPGTINFVIAQAGYYATRSTDTATSVAAVNGDGYDVLFSKIIGTGTLVWFINSAQTAYWSDPADYNILSTIISNALQRQLPRAEKVPTMTEWGMIILIGLLGMASIYSLRRQRII